MEQEIWKDVIGFEGYYEVSDMGNVRSLPPNPSIKRKIHHNGKNLKLSDDGIGYKRVVLCKNGIQTRVRVHRLVWEAFNGKTELPIDHKIEGNRSDNRLGNLQAISHRKNIAKRMLCKAGKSSVYTGVSFKKERNRWVSCFLKNGKNVFLGYYKTELEAHNAYKKGMLDILNIVI